MLFSRAALMSINVVEMAKIHDILICQKSSELPSGLQQNITSRGFTSRVVSSEDSIESALAGLTDPIIIVYCAESQQDVARTTGRLAELKAVHTTPAIVVGHEMERYESFLNQHFALATTLTTPCSSADIIQAIDYIVRYYDKFKQQRASSPVMPSGEIEPSLLEGVPQKVHALYEDFDSIPDLVLQKLMSMNILSRSLRGEEYALNPTVAALSSKKYLPTHPQLRALIKDFTETLPKWSQGHVHRTAFLADLLFGALGYTGDARESGRIAAILFPWTFAESRKDLIRKDYLQQGGGGVRKELCSKIKDSAMRVAADLRLPMPGNIIAALARLVGREEIPSDSTDSLIASCIMAADITDRVCTRAGVFVPNVAYLFLNRIQSEETKDIHPLVLCCLIKILAEAITAGSSLTISKKIRKNPKLREQAELTKNQVVGADEVKVAITSLSPGMKLSRPVVTFDGKEILKGDLVLDEDLIWRIWRLASVRPLNGPVIVFSDA